MNNSNFSTYDPASLVRRPDTWQMLRDVVAHHLSHPRPVRILLRNSAWSIRPLGSNLIQDLTAGFDLSYPVF